MGWPELPGPCILTEPGEAPRRAGLSVPVPALSMVLELAASPLRSVGPPSPPELGLGEVGGPDALEVAGAEAGVVLGARGLVGGPNETGMLEGGAAPPSVPPRTSYPGERRPGSLTVGGIPYWVLGLPLLSGGAAWVGGTPLVVSGAWALRDSSSVLPPTRSSGGAAGAGAAAGAGTGDADALVEGDAAAGAGVGAGLTEAGAAWEAGAGAGATEGGGAVPAPVLRVAEAGAPWL